MPDRRPGRAIEFQHLAGLFASNALNECHITMNLRQSAYLFDLIRRTRPQRVVEIGRHWGGSTVLIAAAMAGEGRFWSIADPNETDWDVEHRDRTRPRAIHEQLRELLSRLDLAAELIAVARQRMSRLILANSTWSTLMEIMHMKPRWAISRSSLCGCEPADRSCSMMRHRIPSAILIVPPMSSG